MNEVSALSPFPARYTSINFTTSQSGECRTKDEKGEMKEEGCSGVDICVDTVCPAVCICTPQIFLCFSLFLLAPSFLLLLSGHEVAQGYSVLSDPIIVSVEERQGQMRHGKTKRWIEQEMKVDEWGEDKRVGHHADKGHHYTIF